MIFCYHNAENVLNFDYLILSWNLGYSADVISSHAFGFVTNFYNYVIICTEMFNILRGNQLY